MSDKNFVSVQESESSLNQLQEKLYSAPNKTQLQVIPQLAARGNSGLAILRDFMLEKKSVVPDLVLGKVYQLLYQQEDQESKEFLRTHFPIGIVPLASEKNVDYQSLQELLAQQDFLAADRLTLGKLCELAGAGAQQRNWLYFTEVDNLPVTDLRTIDYLWLVHSEGKFGFSVQREIWLALGKDFAKLWPKIKWKQGNNWTRYPYEFTWDLSAPRGHIPLSNQLRGVRVIASLLSHPAWSKEK